MRGVQLCAIRMNGIQDTAGSVSPAVVHLFRMVPSDSFTTLATSFTDLLKLCSLADTSRAEDERTGHCAMVTMSVKT